MNKVWLITGSASGLGRNIAEAVLESSIKALTEIGLRTGLQASVVEALQPQRL